MGDAPARSADHDHLDVLRAHGYHALRVKEVVCETDDTRSFVLDVPDELADTFRYKAGQFCTFRVRIGDEECVRSYSMSSAPERDDDLTVTVKRVQGGAVSNWFNDHVAAGAVLELTRPAGVFCVVDGERPLVAFCGGSGITPVVSIAKSVLATTQRPMRLLYANRNRSSVIFDRELRSLQARHAERFIVRHHLDSDAGFLDASGIADFVADNLDADLYICGPGPFMDLVEKTLLEVGVDPGRILIERFDGTGDCGARSVGGPATGEPAVTETVTIILAGQRHTVKYQPGDTILATARRGALKAPFSCEAGNCATCMAVLREGSATMQVNNALAPNEVDEGWILTCQAVPTSRTATVEYEGL